MIREVVEGVYSIECVGCDNNASPANRNCMLCIMRAVSEVKPEMLVLRKGIFSRVLGKGDIKILKDFVDKVPFDEELWSDPLGCYKKDKGSVLGKTMLVKKGSRHKLNPVERYHKVFSNQFQPHFVSSIVDRMKTNGKRYKVKSSHVTVGNGLYIVEPFELGLNKEEVEIVSRTISSISEGFGNDITDVKGRVVEQAKETLSGVKGRRKEDLLDVVVRYTVGYGVLETLFRDKNLQDIYIDSPDNRVHVFHTDAEECWTNLRLSNIEMERLATRFRAASGRAFDQSYPMLYLDLKPYNLRVCGICEPLTFKGIAFAFRKHIERVWTLPAFVSNGMINHDAAGLLDFLVDSQKSILITGARSSGKTSLLASLIAEVNRNYRILVMEDTAELPVKNLKAEGYKIQHIRTRTTGDYEVTVDDALRTALRLGESVLIIGEVRGPEAHSLFEAMRIGAAGNVVMGTIHGSSAYDTWDRVVNDLGVPSTSFKATDVVVTCAATRKGEGAKRTRKVVEIAEVGKRWKDEPVFIPLMEYEDEKLTFGDLAGSGLIKSIARSQNMSMDSAMASIKTRGKIKAFMAGKDLTDVRDVAMAKEEFLRGIGSGYDKVLQGVKAVFGRL